MEEGLRDSETGGELELSFGIGPLRFKLCHACSLSDLGQIIELV